jgi:hypothetical protein
VDPRHLRSARLHPRLGTRRVDARRVLPSWLAARSVYAGCVGSARGVRTRGVRAPALDAGRLRTGIIWTLRLGSRRLGSRRRLGTRRGGATITLLVARHFGARRRPRPARRRVAPIVRASIAALVATAVTTVVGAPVAALVTAAVPAIVTPSVATILPHVERIRSLYRRSRGDDAT